MRRPVRNCATATRSAVVSVAPWAAILPLVSAFTIASGVYARSASGGGTAVCPA